MPSIDETPSADEPKSRDDICQALLSVYDAAIPRSERFCHALLEQTWATYKPLEGKRVLFNCHITLSTLMTYRLLLIAGAELEVTASQKEGEELAIQALALTAAKNAGVTYLENGHIPESKRIEYYDVVIDCGAGMLTIVTPKSGGGMVELTHTDPSLYSSINFPVINIDDSDTKTIETGFGTGDSIVRLLTDSVHTLLWESLKRLNEAPSTLPNMTTFFFAYIQQFLPSINLRSLFETHRFMIFGAGKVGTGIRNALISAGCPMENIVIIEKDHKLVLGLKGNRFNAFHLTATTRETIKEKIKSVHYVITATGIKNAISEDFGPDDFADTTLINMGTPDEFGWKFSAERMLNGIKGPANFQLEYPTKVMYLDPIFALLVQGAVHIIQNSLRKGLQLLPKTLDEGMQDKWDKQHGDDIWAHTRCAAELDRKIRAVERRPTEWKILKPTAPVHSLCSISTCARITPEVHGTIAREPSDVVAPVPRRPAGPLLNPNSVIRMFPNVAAIHPHSEPPEGNAPQSTVLSV